MSKPKPKLKRDREALPKDTVKKLAAILKKMQDVLDDLGLSLDSDTMTTKELIDCAHDDLVSHGGNGEAKAVGELIQGQFWCHGAEVIRYWAAALDDLMTMDGEASDSPRTNEEFRPLFSAELKRFLEAMTKLREGYNATYDKETE